MLRLTLGIGPSSIGWWLSGLSEGRPAQIIDGSVRLFSDGRVRKQAHPWPLSAARPELCDADEIGTFGAGHRWYERWLRPA